MISSEVLLEGSTNVSFIFGESNINSRMINKKQKPDGIPFVRAGSSGNQSPLTDRDAWLSAGQNFRVKVGLG